MSLSRVALLNWATVSVNHCAANFFRVFFEIRFGYYNNGPTPELDWIDRRDVLAGLTCGPMAINRISDTPVVPV